jgi:pathogenesis-related protein 1
LIHSQFSGKIFCFRQKRVVDYLSNYYFLNHFLFFMNSILKQHFILSVSAVLLVAGVAVAQESALNPSGISAEEAQQIVDYHNKVRAEVRVPPLEWSPELAAFAQEWANYLASKGCALQHRPRDGGKWAQKYGENIFWGMGKTYTVLDAGKAWYSEKKFWKGGKLNGTNWSKAGHYTQMVWSKSTKVGLGRAVCKNGATIIVGNYDPAGNMIGESPY